MTVGYIGKCPFCSTELEIELSTHKIPTGMLKCPHCKYTCSHKAYNKTWDDYNKVVLRQTELLLADLRQLNRTEKLHLSKSGEQS